MRYGEMTETMSTPGVKVEVGGSRVAERHEDTQWPRVCLALAYRVRVCVNSLLQPGRETGWKGKRRGEHRGARGDRGRGTSGCPLKSEQENNAHKSEEGQNSGR